MSIARKPTHDQDEIRTWIAARRSDADGVIGSSVIPLTLDGGGSPPSGVYGVSQLDLFDPQPIAVRSTPQINRYENSRPSDLDGTRGRFRRAREDSLLDAENDYEAIQAWVRTKGAADADQRPSNTQRAYLREAERLLLWAIIERAKPISSLTHEDCAEYVAFLSDPAPTCRWCGPRSADRWSPAWRPFEGPLSATARRQAIVILNNLFTFLLAKGYLTGNAMAGIRRPRGSDPRIDAGRSFTKRQWSQVEVALAGMPPSAERQRLSFALHLLYATGLRLSEATDARLGDLEEVEPAGNTVAGSADSAWLLTVRGKGGRMREVPVPAELMAELSGYLIGRGLNPNVHAAENRAVPLLARLSAPPRDGSSHSSEPAGLAASARLSHSALYKILKAFFMGVASALRARGDDADADRFEQASTHWLRHTHASHSIAQGVPIEIAQQNLGHSSLSITTVYVKTERDRRVRAVESFWVGVVGRR